MTNEERMALIKKNPISVGCGVLSVLLIAGIYFRSDEIPTAEADLASKSAEAERLSLNRANANQLKEQYDEVVAANKAIETRMVKAASSGLGQNTQYFYRLFAETGVKQIDFGQTTNVVAPTKGKTTYTPIAFRVVVQGSFAQVMNFLGQLEEGTHYCRVLTAQLSGSAANRNSPLTLSLNLELLGLP